LSDANTPSISPTFQIGPPQAHRIPCPLRIYLFSSLLLLSFDLSSGFLFPLYLKGDLCPCSRSNSSFSSPKERPSLIAHPPLFLTLLITSVPLETICSWRRTPFPFELILFFRLLPPILLSECAPFPSFFFYQNLFLKLPFFYSLLCGEAFPIWAFPRHLPPSLGSLFYPHSSPFPWLHSDPCVPLFLFRLLLAFKTFLPSTLF